MTTIFQEAKMLDKNSSHALTKSPLRSIFGGVVLNRKHFLQEASTPESLEAFTDRLRAEHDGGQTENIEASKTKK